jgi:hypothetical protein
MSYLFAQKHFTNNTKQKELTLTQNKTHTPFLQIKELLFSVLYLKNPPHYIFLCFTSEFTSCLYYLRRQKFKYIVKLLAIDLTSFFKIKKTQKHVIK